MKAPEAPTEHRVRVNEVELAYFEWRRALRGSKAPILLAHATGFHARVWDRTIQHLGERYIIALDQRGHGRSQKTQITHWKVFGDDLAAFVRTLDLRDVVGVGHSMGGHAMTEAAAACPDRFRRLVLIDPVIAAPEEYNDPGRLERWRHKKHPIAKRRNRFTSPEQMFERFRDRPPYAGFDPAALRDYCEYGLLPAPDGNGYVLACPPEIEASIYMTSRTNGAVYDSARAIDVPVLILRAKRPRDRSDVMDFASSPTWPGLVREFKHGREVYLADHTHFLPLEAPKLVAEYILGTLTGS